MEASSPTLNKAGRWVFPAVVIVSRTVREARTRSIQSVTRERYAVAIVCRTVREARGTLQGQIERRSTDPAARRPAPARPETVGPLGKPLAYLFGVGGVPASLRQTARETLDTLYRRRFQFQTDIPSHLAATIRDNTTTTYLEFQFQTDIPSHLACYSRSIAWEADKSNAFRESLFWGRFAFNNADTPCPPFSWSGLWCAPRI